MNEKMKNQRGKNTFLLKFDNTKINQFYGDKN